MNRFNEIYREKLSFFNEKKGKLEEIGTDKYGNLYLYLPLEADSFVHFTSKERAEEILESGVIMHDPPHDSMGAVGAFAVSTVYGYSVPNVQTTHIKSGPVVAIYFKTDSMPRIGFPEETVWDTDINLINPQVISKKYAVSMLKKRSDEDPEYLVFYDRMKAVKSLEG